MTRRDASAKVTPDGREYGLGTNANISERISEGICVAGLGLRSSRTRIFASSNSRLSVQTYAREYSSFKAPENREMGTHLIARDCAANGKRKSYHVDGDM